MYKLVAVDLDGTLLNSYGEITQNTKKVLESVQQKGVQIMIASGRPIDSIKTIANEINSKKFFIAGNGAIIYDIENEKVVYEKYISKINRNGFNIDFIGKYKCCFGGYASRY